MNSNAGKSVDQQIDDIFSEIDGLMRAHRFEDVDKILQCVDTEQEPINILIAYLTISLPLRDRLSRRHLYDRILHRLTIQDNLEGKRVYGLLNGLS